MAKTLTLEEAAQKLGLTPEQFKSNLKVHKDFKSVRPLMGGATMHFRAQDIDELARRLGLGSEPELQLGDASSDPVIPLSVAGDDQIEIGREAPRGAGGSGVRLSGSKSGTKRTPPPKPVPDVPLVTDSSEDFVPLSQDKSKPAKPDSAAKVTKPDSNVRLESRGAKPGDSSGTEEVIDLEGQKRPSSKHKKAGDVFELAPESGGKSSSDRKKTTPKKPIDNSEFELKLGAGSSSEFELTLANEGGDEVDLGSMPRDVSGKKGGSGVNLNKPADSGISLEKDSDDEFELNIDSSSKKLAPKSSGKRKAEVDSDSEFELTLDDSSSEIPPLDASGAQSDKDIFETDFDIPALDDESASEAVALEEGDTDLESSDFDLALEEGAAAEDSASEVVELDEGAAVEAVDDEGASAEEALAGVEGQRSRVVSAGPAKWGPLPVIVGGLALLVLFPVTIMGYELVHSMWGYHQPANKPTSMVTRGIASIFNSDSELPKEP